VVIGGEPASKRRPGAAGYAELPGDRPKKIGSTTDWPKNWNCASRSTASREDAVHCGAEWSTGGRVASPSRDEGADRMYPGSKGHETASGCHNTGDGAFTEHNSLKRDVLGIDERIALETSSKSARRDGPSW